MAITEPTFNEIAESEAKALLDRQTRKYLDLSVDDFIAKWDRGDYRESDDPHVRRLAVLIPLGRPHSG
jgi:hypothetical protein